MTIAPTVMKFGGTSVADAAAFRRVAEIVVTRAERRPVVVVSAMSGVTDALVSAARAAAEHGADAERIRAEHLDAHLARHLAVAAELLPPAARREFDRTLDDARAEITELLTTLARAPASMHGLLQDTIVSQGERLSSRLLAHVLAARGLPARFADARRSIITDDDHGRARPHMTETRRAVERELAPLIRAGAVPVLGGFIGSSRSGATTTLGRNGSDYSAALVAAALRARDVEIWTDTSGVLTADPRAVPAARTVARLSYGEATDLARAGAKVLYPKTIAPLVEHNIPLRVRNSRDPAAHGTIVTAETALPGAKSIALRRGVTVVRVTPALDAEDDTFLELAAGALARHRGALDLCLVAPAGATFVTADEAAADALAAELGAHSTTIVERRRALITIVGERMNPAAVEGAAPLRALGDLHADPLAHGASSASRSFVVEEAHAAEAVARLHRQLFEKN